MSEVVYRAEIPLDIVSLTAQIPNRVEAEPPWPFSTIRIAADSDIDFTAVKPANARDYMRLGVGRSLSAPPGEQWIGPVAVGAAFANVKVMTREMTLASPALGSIAVTNQQLIGAFGQEPSTGNVTPPLKRPALILEFVKAGTEMFPSDLGRVPLHWSRALQVGTTEILVGAWCVAGRAGGLLSVLVRGGAPTGNCSFRLAASALGTRGFQSTGAQGKAVQVYPLPSGVDVVANDTAVSVNIDDRLEYLYLFAASDQATQEIQFRFEAWD